MKNITAIYLVILGAMAFSCSEEEQQYVEPNWTTAHSTFINERFSEEEEIRIRLFLNQKQSWKAKETGTGLRYWIYEDEEGEVVQPYDVVDVKFEIRLLTDSLLYKTDEGEVSTFKVDRSDVESGVMEGIKYLSEGDKAKFIIPSHIGHGLLGDFQNIPPLEVLIVDLELVKIH